MHRFTFYQYSHAYYSVDGFGKGEEPCGIRELIRAGDFGFENVGGGDVAGSEGATDSSDEVVDMGFVPAGADYADADRGSVERREVYFTFSAIE